MVGVDEQPGLERKEGVVASSDVRERAAVPAAVEDAVEPAGLQPPLVLALDRLVLVGLRLAEGVEQAGARLVRLGLGGAAARERAGAVARARERDARRLGVEAQVDVAGEDREVGGAARKLGVEIFSGLFVLLDGRLPSLFYLFIFSFIDEWGERWLCD